VTAGLTEGRKAGRSDGQTAGLTDKRPNGPTGGRTGGRADGRADRVVGARPGGRAAGTDGRADGPAGGQDEEHMRRLLTSTGCREEVVAEVCAAAYSVMPPPGRAARTDSDQVRTVRLASKTRMNDKSKQNKS